MATLKSEHKEFIVKGLACYVEPKEIQLKLKELYDVKASPSQISNYNPDLPSTKRLGEKWKELFRYTRDEFLESVSEIPIAHKAYRLNVLQKNLDSAMKGKANLVLANQILEQAAKEMGGAFEGKLPEGGTGSSVTVYQQINQKIEQYHEGKK